MPVQNVTIAALLREMADLLDIEGANRFRVRAYRDAATTIEDLSESVADLVEEGADLTELHGVGDDLAGKIREIVQIGTFADLERLRERHAAGLTDLLTLPSLGPKRVRTLHAELGIEGIEELADAARSGQLRSLSGFGEKTEAQVLEGIEQGRRKKQRRKLASVEEEAETIEAFIRGIEGVDRVEVAGSYRRKQATVGDLDIVAASREPARVIAEFVEYDDIDAVISKGKTRSSVRLRSGLQADLRVVDPSSFGAALLYFTGSRPHTLALRDRAVIKELKLNEYGIYRDDERLAGETEEDVYRELGLPYIVPELRENRGELDTVNPRELPELIELDDIRGDLHCHTRASDGKASIEEMARAARERGYEYLAITDHSRRLAVANGLDPDRVREQMAEIDRLNDDNGEVVLLTGIEVDMLEDGSLDLPGDLLEQLDIVVCSIHHELDLPEAEQTERMLRAIDNPHCQIIGHPTGRMLTEREPSVTDLRRVIEAATETGCALELNADPNRLDLSDIQCKMAAEAGVKIVISTDAHSTSALQHMRYGVWQARRGWLEAGNVLNTLSLDRLRDALKRT